MDQRIRVSAVVLRDVYGAVLMVRKRGTDNWMNPGGKPLPGESALGCAMREVAEELRLALDPSRLVYLGELSAPAANEPGHIVVADVFVYAVPIGDPEPAREIEEIRWVTGRDLCDETLAPLYTRQIFPRLQPYLPLCTAPASRGDTSDKPVRLAFDEMTDWRNRLRKASMRSALIVVDVQVDFCENGALGVAGGNAVAERIAGLLTAVHDFDHIVATRDHHIDPGEHFSTEPDFIDSWPPHCVVGTSGQDLHPALRGFGFEAIFDKGAYEAAYSGFDGTIGGGPDSVGLSMWLRAHEVEAVYICGIATDYCVRATALDATHEGFATTILADLTAAVHPDDGGALRKELAGAGIAWAEIRD